MAEAVTYADLRFAKGAPNKSRPPVQDSPPPADGPAAPPADGSDGDGELTYENCPPARPCQPKRAPGPGPRRRWSVPLLALLGSCLFLLATCLALGVRYWQVSQELQRASQRHASLAQRIDGGEWQLAQAQAELNATRLALWESWQVGNDTQRQLEGKLRLAESGLTLLQRDKENATGQLEEAKWILKQVASCQKTNCCPAGWKVFNQKCLWMSWEGKTWEQSKQDCQSRSSQLLMLKPWNAGNRRDAEVITLRHTVDLCPVCDPLQSQAPSHIQGR